MKFQRVVAIGGIFIFALTGPALTGLLESVFAGNALRESVSLSAPAYDYESPHTHYEISGETEPSTLVGVAASGQQANVAAHSVAGSIWKSD